MRAAVECIDGSKGALAMKCANCEREISIREIDRKPLERGNAHVDGECPVCCYPYWMHTKEGRWRDAIVYPCHCGSA